MRNRKAGPRTSRGGSWSTRFGRRSTRPGSFSFESAIRPGRSADAPPRRSWPMREQRVQSAVEPYYRKVINATGIILHTALGRAVLPAKRPAPDRSRTVGLLARPGRHPERPAIAARRTHRTSSCSNSPAPRRPRWSTTTPRPRRSCSIRSPAAGRSSSRAASWSRSAARSACPT